LYRTISDHLWTGKSSCYVASHPGQLSLAIRPQVAAKSRSLQGIRGEV